MAATSIALVGITYSVALRALWHPTGLQRVADVALHDATPLLFRTGVGGRAAPGPQMARDRLVLPPPAAYLAYALARGAIDGWYAYWFLNPAEQDAGQMLVSVALLLCAVAVIAAVLVAADRWLGSQENGQARFVALAPTNGLTRCDGFAALLGEILRCLLEVLLENADQSASAAVVSSPSLAGKIFSPLPPVVFLIVGWLLPLNSRNMNDVRSERPHIIAFV